MATSAPCACTHTNVTPNKMVALSSMGTPNDNSGDHPFYYDRQSGSAFGVPRGWSFVVTDIILYASPTAGPIPNPSRFVLVVVNFTNGGERTFQAGITGDQTAHYPLSGSFVIPAGNVPTFRNTTFSNSYAEAQLLGYFVQAPGLQAGEKVTF